METSFLTQWFSGPETKAICWTLIHSLWIGMIIALIAAAVISATRKSAADLRYRLLCSALVLFVLSISVTFYLETRSGSVSAPATINRINTVAHTNIPNANYTGQPAEVSTINKAISFLDMHVDIIFMVWLLFFVMKSLKMIGGLLYIQRIRHYKVHEVAEEFKQKIELFSRQIDIRQTIRLVQSELVKVPVAIGWLKPLILLPVGVILQLTPEQLDGILWHELAHIKRRDYLVNILQGLVETVFFFNPGLLWLSSLIRAEREACCDDMVLSQVGHKANYLEALLSFGFSECKQAGLAMGLGSGSQLRDRLKRIVNQENKKLNVAEKTVLSVGLIVLCAFTTIPKTSTAVKHFSLKFINPSGKLVNRTTAIKSADLKRADTGSITIARVRQDEEKKPGRTDTAINFVSVLFKQNNADLANCDIRAKDDKDQYYHFTVANNTLVAMEINNVKISDNELPGYRYMIRYIDRVIDEKRRVSASDIVAFKAKSPMAKFKGDDGYVKHQLDSLKIAQKQRPPGGGNHVSVTEGDRVRPKMEAMSNRGIEDSINYTSQLQRTRNVIIDLVKEKVVANAAAVKWFGLSETEFIVNGQKQPAEMQQRYMAKYGIHKNYGLYYGPVQMQGTGIFIDATASNTGGWQRPVKDERPEPIYIGEKRQRSADSVLWNVKQIAKQQQLFASSKGEKRKKLIKEQLKQLRVNDQPGSKMQLPEVIANITNDLVSENIVRDKSELQGFRLTNSALIVNGKTLPEGIHQKLKLKYLRSGQYSLDQQLVDDPNFGVHYNVAGGMWLGIMNGTIGNE